MVARTGSAHLHAAFRLSVREQHLDQYGRPVAPTPDAEKQRSAAWERHVARWEAVKAARASGLPWSACWTAAAEALAGTAARGAAETMRASYKLVQRSRRQPG